MRDYKFWRTYGWGLLLVNDKVLALVDTLVKKNSKRILGMRGGNKWRGWGSLDDVKQDVIIELYRDCQQHYNPLKGTPEEYYYRIIKQKINRVMLKYKSDASLDPTTIRKIIKLKQGETPKNAGSVENQERLRNVNLVFSRPEQRVGEAVSLDKFVDKSSDNPDNVLLETLLDREKLTEQQIKILDTYLAGHSCLQISKKLEIKYTIVLHEMSRIIEITRNDNEIRV